MSQNTQSRSYNVYRGTGAIREIRKRDQRIENRERKKCPEKENAMLAHRE
jgi:hypothetical protein